MNNRLFDAVRNDNLLNVRELIANGVDVNCRDIYGNTPLFKIGSVEMAQLLVANGADVNCRNYNDNTPLHFIQLHKIGQLLVLNGADINCRDKCGNTPLHLSNSLGIFQFLMENSADIHIKNKGGKSAYDYAIDFECNELIELFEHYNAISNGLDIKEPCDE